MNFRFRKATNDDLTFILELEKEAFPEYQQSSRQNLIKGIKSPFQEIIIAENTNRKTEPVGSAVLFKYKDTLRIYSIGVIAEYRSKGAGREILRFIKEFAAKNNFRNISLEARANNDTLIEWYKKHGFNILERLPNYYLEGEDAFKMLFKIEENEIHKSHRNLIVIDQPYSWEQTDINAKVISVKEYINDTEYQTNSSYRIFNLCSSYRYQSYGYYVSLLASARGQRVIPNITTIRDFRIINVIQSAAHDLDELINDLLEKEQSKTFSLDVYFGQTPVEEYKSLAAKLYQIFEAPLFRVNFVKHEKWLIQSMKALSFKHLDSSQRGVMYELASGFFKKKRHNYPKLINYLYDLAVLVNPNEENPPSDKKALEKLRNAANRKGVYVEFITKEERDKINEFDALFIRETTNVNHHTYEISRFAYAEGLVVIDDPWSVLRCSNKIYQFELFKRNKIRTPNTFALTKNIFELKSLDGFNYPLVLKQPDSAFSLGVSKVSSKEEAEEKIKSLFKVTDMIICQEFLYSDFDWRIGVLDNKPLFACKYFMSKDHWQIYNWSSDKEDKSGNYETIAIENVPSDVLQVAQKAASLIGDGLYGVDLKYKDGKVYVIEVNDNPNIDAGVEDKILKNELYSILIESIINRIEIAKNIRRISLVKDN